MEAGPQLARRLARVRAAMAARGLGGLVVYHSGQHTMLRMDQLRHLTDFKCLGPAALLVPRTGALSLLVSPAWDLARARAEVPGCAVEAVEPDELARAIAEGAARLPMPVALSGRETMLAGFARDLLGRFAVAPLEGTDLVRDLATTRDALELERIARAAEIADEGFRTLCASAEIGMREYELAAEVEAAMQAAGSEDNYGLMGAGAHNRAIRPPTDRRIEAGDLIVGEITPCYRGAFAQLCRTFVMGRPSAVQREKYDLLIRAEEAGFRAALPGRPSSDIARAVNAVIAAAGYAEYCRQPYMRTRGHGLGFGGVVPADVTEESSPMLEPDMTMVIHPNQYLPETGYMMLGDTVVIADGGPRILTQTARRLFAQDA